MRFLQSYRTIVVLISATSLLALLIILSSGPQHRFALDPLTALVAAMTVGLACARLALGVPSRAARQVWFMVIAILVLVCVAQFAPPLSREGPRSVGLDDTKDAVLLAAAPLFLWAA